MKMLELNEPTPKTISWEDFLAKNKQINFIFSENQLKKILEQLGYVTNDEGYVIYSETKELMTSTTRKHFKVNEIGCVLPGKYGAVFVLKDVPDGHLLAIKQKLGLE